MAVRRVNFCNMFDPPQASRRYASFGPTRVVIKLTVFLTPFPCITFASFVPVSQGCSAGRSSRRTDERISSQLPRAIRVFDSVPFPGNRTQPGQAGAKEEHAGGFRNDDLDSPSNLSTTLIKRSRKRNMVLDQRDSHGRRPVARA